MSMFHELMMKKKEEIMYATIKGSLTENDGVFSGFSASNYLALQQPFTLNADTIAEIKLKINIPSYKTGNSFIGTNTDYGFAFMVASDGIIRIYFGDGSSWIISNGTGINVLSLDTDYYIKININNNYLTLSISTDDINYVIDYQNNIGLTNGRSYNIRFAQGRVDTQYFNGSIDLNQSYIKIANTKYQLQAVVGYTVVGSPTITDGVVSGFSYNDYVKVTNMPLANNYEINIPFNYSTVQNQAIFSFGTGSVSCLRLTNAGKFIFYLLFNYTLANAVALTSDKIVYANTDYIIKLKGKNGIHQMLLSSDNGASWELLDTKEYNFTIPSDTFNFGIASSLYSVGFGGSMNMNNNYVKINNKLWFNGQQA